MALIVPDSYELKTIQDVTGSPLKIHLYGNDYTPAGSLTLAAFTEISGGGYAAKDLLPDNWNLAAGDPTTATYNQPHIWTFTGPLDAPGTAYGYYVTRNSDNLLMWAERFPAAALVFSPIAGSQVRMLVRYSVQSQF